MLKIIPVYGAYKVEEDLREWDRSVRDEAVLYLTSSEDQLFFMLQKAVKNRDREVISELEDTRRDIHSVKENVKNATYGFFPRQSPIKIKEDTLKQALDIDEKVVTEAKVISDKLAVLSTKFLGQKKEAIMDLADVKSNIQNIKTILLDRKNLLRKGFLKEEK